MTLTKGTGLRKSPVIRLPQSPVCTKGLNEIEGERWETAGIDTKKPILMNMSFLQNESKLLSDLNNLSTISY